MSSFARCPVVALLITGIAFFAGCDHLNRMRYSQTQTDKPLGLLSSDKKVLRLPPYLFYADFELDRNLPLFRELASLREQVYRELQLPDAEKTIKVYLFKNKTKYDEFISKSHPDQPNRRAYFVITQANRYSPEEMLVYTYWSEQIQQDLRHELTHALLHSVLKDVPLWLDEGLAEYFETPKRLHGVNPAHLKQIQSAGLNRFQPNLSGLEKLTAVRHMGGPQYREAWAWVHFMLRGDSAARKVLLSYLRELRANANPGPLRPRLSAVVSSPEAALQRHLRSWPFPKAN